MNKINFANPQRQSQAQSRSQRGSIFMVCLVCMGLAQICVIGYWYTQHHSINRNSIDLSCDVMDLQHRVDAVSPFLQSKKSLLTLLLKQGISPHSLTLDQQGIKLTFVSTQNKSLKETISSLETVVNAPMTIQSVKEVDNQKYISLISEQSSGICSRQNTQSLI